MREAAGGRSFAPRASRTGLSIDMVAQHLKLAPRQVRALEDGDYEQLPGRTFVRGFVRNYARLMQLDAESIVAALPDAAGAGRSDMPQQAPSTRADGRASGSQHRERSALAALGAAARRSPRLPPWLRATRLGIARPARARPDSGNARTRDR